MIALSIEQGFPYWLALGTVWRGWALTKYGQVEKGITQIRQGMDAFLATGAELACSYWFALLADTHGKGGQIEEGLAWLAKALAFVYRTGERIHEAELYRLKGELTLQLKIKNEESRVGIAHQEGSIAEAVMVGGAHPTEEEAEGYFLKAIDISRKQQAKSLELRAVMSLARLWQQQGKKAEAHKKLSEVYHWFTEGFDTKDLQEAKALLVDMDRAFLRNH
jgi:predicted ATPase